MSSGRPVRAVTIPTGPGPAVAGEVDASDAGLSLIVDGPTEVVTLSEDAAVFVNARGKAQGLPPNPRATRLIDSYVPGFARADTVMGNAVVTGFDEQGLPADVPAQAQDRALRS